jgi:hypothetical protein
MDWIAPATSNTGLQIDETIVIALESAVKPANPPNRRRSQVD